MTNKEKDLLLEALDNLKREVYFGSYLTSHSSMNIEEKAYAEEKMKNIDALIKNINANKDNDPDNEKIKIFDYLVANWAHKAYNPKGDYYVVSFTICDNNVYKALEKHLQNVYISLKVKGY